MFSSEKKENNQLKFLSSIQIARGTSDSYKPWWFYSGSPFIVPLLSARALHVYNEGNVDLNGGNDLWKHLPFLEAISHSRPWIPTFSFVSLMHLELSNLLIMVISVPSNLSCHLILNLWASSHLYSPVPLSTVLSFFWQPGTAGLLTLFSLPRDRVNLDMPRVLLNDLIQGRLTFQQREPCSHRELLVLGKKITHTHTHTHTKILRLFGEIKVCMRYLCFCFLFLFQRRCTDQVDTYLSVS